MPRLTRVLALLTLCCGAGAAGAVEVVHFEPLTHLTRAAAVSAASPPGQAAPFTLAFNALGRDFALELEHNARLSEVERTLHLPAAVAAYRGKLKGNPDSWARIVMSGATPMGLVWDGQTLFAIEAASDSAARGVTPTAAVMFRLADVYVPPGTLQCGSADLTTGADMLAAIAGDTAQVQALQAQGATLNLDLGAVADYEFSQSFGANAETALLARFNNVDGIFSGQLGIQVNVPPAAVEIFTSSNDPFTSTDPSTLLDEVAQYRGGSAVQDAQGLTHLFTGRDLDGTTAGIAYVGQVCQHRNPRDSLGRSFGVGLSEGTHGLTIDSLIAAHEMGHNMGAPHDAEAGSPCEATPATFLMAPTINGSSTFSDCSLAQMQPVIDAADCLTPIGPPDVALAVTSQSAPHPATVPFDYVIDARNLGIDPATGVSVAITHDAGLSVDAASAASGSCTIATPDVTCTLGDIPGGVSRLITLTLSAAATGDFAITALATADQDNNPTNNSVSDTLTSEASIDLGLSGTAAALALNASGVLDLTLLNAGDFTAHNLVVDIAVPAGLHADAASLAGSACALGGATVSCTLSTLDARQSQPLQLTLTATTVGQQPLNLSVSGDETDINSANDSLVLLINVPAPPSSSTGSGGGGGTGAELALLLLALAALRSRARSTRIRG